MNSKRKSYPGKLEEYGVVLIYLDEIRRVSRPEGKEALYRLLDAAYRKGYEAAKEEQ